MLISLLQKLETPSIFHCPNISRARLQTIQTVPCLTTRYALLTQQIWPTILTTIPVISWCFNAANICEYPEACWKITLASGEFVSYHRNWTFLRGCKSNLFNGPWLPVRCEKSPAAHLPGDSSAGSRPEFPKFSKHSATLSRTLPTNSMSNSLGTTRGKNHSSQKIWDPDNRRETSQFKLPNHAKPTDLRLLWKGNLHFWICLINRTRNQWLFQGVSFPLVSSPFLNPVCVTDHQGFTMGKPMAWGCPHRWWRNRLERRHRATSTLGLALRIPGHPGPLPGMQQKSDE